jgi:regulator of cell morphogenesis and NO signaling
MKDLLTTSLAQIVTGNHKTASVFEKHHLDFCCKGKRTLQQACVDKGLNAEEIVTELEMANTTLPDDNFNPDNLMLTELADHIVNTHHAYVKNELPLILGYLQKVASKHGERHPELYKIFELFAAVKEEMELHMQKEERILFPRIGETERLVADHATLSINKNFLAAPVLMMEQEHDHAGSMMAEIRKLSNNYVPPADACTTYRLSFSALQAFEMDLHRHVHLENNILFPKALHLFDKFGSHTSN